MFYMGIFDDVAKHAKGMRRRLVRRAHDRLLMPLTMAENCQLLGCLIYADASG